MTTMYKQELEEPSPGFQSNCIDPLDIEQYINFDQAIFPSPSNSTSSSKAKTGQLPSASTSFTSAQSAPQQTFSGPSHQYEQYKQQAGLPVGALANTFALNEPNQFSYTETHPYDIITPTDGYFGMNNTDDFVDFGTAPIQTSTDIDMDLSTSSHEMSILNSSFVEPSAIEPSTPRARSTSSQPSRAWPGMHQQQAALAKAQQEAMQQRQQAAVVEQPRNKLPSNAPKASHSRQSSRPNADPIIEESISRLLNQMRHSSVASSVDDDASTPTASGSSYARMRKDEEDMDEDERLLASEEGKKLSSKERRQLRNKVSARAFRSRRKEYIGQLEGEIAAKCSEADELRVKNEELMSENTRLTDLTRMLLSSSAFSTFLNDLSNSGVPPSMPENIQTNTTMNQQPQQQEHQQRNFTTQPAPRKDANPHQVPSQPHSNNMHVGMTMIPESPFEYAPNQSINNGWTDNSNNGLGLYDAQVYAVTALPEAPAFEEIDFGRIHGKSSNYVGSYSSIDDDAKNEPATIESMPAVVSKDLPTHQESSFEDVDFDESDPAFALFAGQPSPSLSSPQQTCASVAPEERIFGEIALEKALERIELVVSADDESEVGEVSAATMDRFERLCSRLDASGARISAVTGDL